MQKTDPLERTAQRTHWQTVPAETGVLEEELCRKGEAQPLWNSSPQVGRSAGSSSQSGTCREGGPLSTLSTLRAPEGLWGQVLGGPLRFWQGGGQKLLYPGGWGTLFRRRRKHPWASPRRHKILLQMLQLGCYPDRSSSFPSPKVQTHVRMWGHRICPAWRPSQSTSSHTNRPGQQTWQSGSFKPGQGGGGWVSWGCFPSQPPLLPTSRYCNSWEWLSGRFCPSSNSSEPQEREMMAVDLQESSCVDGVVDPASPSSTAPPMRPETPLARELLSLVPACPCAKQTPAPKPALPK